MNNTIPRLLLAGVATLNCSFDEELPDDVRDALHAEQEDAKTATWERKAAHYRDAWEGHQKYPPVAVQQLGKRPGRPRKNRWIWLA
jgi:hypothetical protein